MHNRATAGFAVVVLACLIPATGLAVEPYSQTFEGLSQTDPSALADDGWLVFGNVFTAGGTFLYGYGSFPAPNDGLAFCRIVIGEGGVEQGAQQLVVFSDYENADHAAGNIIESNVFQEQVVGTVDVGTTWRFEFEAKLGNLEGSSTALAFIKTLDPSSGWALTNLITADMTAIPETWNTYSLELPIDESLEGQILQFGFLNNATSYEGSGIFYDNLAFYKVDQTGVPPSATVGASLRQNYPNPFNPSTRIDFVLDRPGVVTVSVLDLAGRRVATLVEGELVAGEHHVTWNGRTDSGRAVSAGQYRYVLRTGTGQTSRSMVLVK
ncbi:MAG: FlgD immunoglobulin-like domain containing protein [Candidatus Krumholzibacteriia bacterium]